MAGARATWTGKEGDDYTNNSKEVDLASTNAGSVEMMGVTCTEIYKPAIASIELNLKTSKLLEIGCNIGGMLCVFEGLGFQPENLYGVDINETSIKKCKELHPKFKTLHVEGFNYEFNDVESFDIVFMRATMMHIPPDMYRALFDKIRSLKPKYFMFNEATNPNGYQKLELEGNWDFHSNDFEKVCAEHLPEGKLVYRKQIDFSNEEIKSWFLPMTHDMLCIYQITKF